MWNKIKCALGKHDLFIVKRLSSQAHLIGCHRCKRYFGMNHDVRAVLPFTIDLCNMYETTFNKRGLKKYITKDRPFSIFRG